MEKISLILILILRIILTDIIFCYRYAGTH